jgi:hypothetical protein
MLDMLQELGVQADCMMVQPESVSPLERKVRAFQVPEYYIFGLCPTGKSAACATAGGPCQPSIPTYLDVPSMA